MISAPWNILKLEFLKQDLDWENPGLKLGKGSNLNFFQLLKKNFNDPGILKIVDPKIKKKIFFTSLLICYWIEKIGWQSCYCYFHKILLFI